MKAPILFLALSILSAIGSPAFADGPSGDKSSVTESVDSSIEVVAPRQMVRPIRFDRWSGRSKGEVLRELLLDAYAVLNFAAFGAIIGSFLNVVIYRLPRGKNLLWPASRCPRCETPILLRDNLPVIGWLKLGGRCRACSASISIRYPLVEFAIAAIWTVLGVLVILTGGVTLPGRTPNALAGATFTLWDTQWDLVRIYLYHCTLVTTIAAMVGIAVDRQRIPARLILALLVAMCAFPLIWPDLHPAPLVAPPPRAVNEIVVPTPGKPAPRPAWLTEWPPIVVGAAETLAGMVAGAVVGGALRISNRFRIGEKRLQTGVWPAMLAIGAALGWQGTVSVGLIAAMIALLRLALRILSGASHAATPLMSVLLALLIQLAGWRWIDANQLWPGTAASDYMMFVSVVAIAGLSAMARLLTSRQYDASLAISDRSELAVSNHWRHETISWRDVLEPQHYLEADWRASDDQAR